MTVFQPYFQKSPKQSDNSNEGGMMVDYLIGIAIGMSITTLFYDFYFVKPQLKFLKELREDLKRRR